MTSCTGRYRRPVATSRPTRRAATYSLTGRPRLGGLTHVPGCERHPTTPNSRKPRLWQRQRRRNRLASEPESSDPGLGRVDYATVASNAATGAPLRPVQRCGHHLRRHREGGGGQPGWPYRLRHRRSWGRRYHYATVAYDAAAGRSAGPAATTAVRTATNSPTPCSSARLWRTLYVTGASPGRTSRKDFATVAYNAATGAHRWVGRFNARRPACAGRSIA